jgi:hypothetical protein
MVYCLSNNQLSSSYIYVNFLKGLQDDDIGPKGIINAKLRTL